MVLSELEGKIAQRSATIGVIGLGHIGLPVACAFAAAGFRVEGVDINPALVRRINEGVSPIEGDEPGLAELLRDAVRSKKFHAHSDYTVLRKADVILICVETPVDEDHVPRYAALKSACETLGSLLKRGALVIVESTVSPGTTANLVRPLIEKGSGTLVNDGFYLGVCPERLTPGRLLSNLRDMSRVCGGLTPETAAVMVSLYRQIVAVEVDAADTITAELVKTAENAYRDVQIAFANEVALLCEQAGADAWRVRDLVNKCPGREMHRPGAGVGGHCIPKDSWLLAQAGKGNVPSPVISAARQVNDHMPLHFAEMTVAALRQAGRRLDGARVAVLGYSYVKDSGDTRSSPSALYIERLQALGVETAVHDPWVTEFRGDLTQRVKGADAIALLMDHSEYRDLNFGALRAKVRTPIVMDGRGMFDGAAVRTAGFLYYGIGRSDLLTPGRQKFFLPGSATPATGATHTAIRNAYRGKRVLITGGAGFVGSSAAKRLVELGATVTIIDDLSTGRRELLPDDICDFVEASVLDRELVREQMAGADFVFHMAARNIILSTALPADDFAVNVGGTLNVLLAASAMSSPPVVLYTSSASVYGNAELLPTPENARLRALSPYAASKLGGESYCQAYRAIHDLPVVAVRLSNVYGINQSPRNPYCGVISKFLMSCRDKQPLRIHGDGCQTRDFTYIDDAVTAILLAAATPDAYGEEINVATGRETSIRELARLIREREEPSPPIEFVRPRLIDSIKRRVLDTSKARSLLNWRARTTLEEGLALTRDWIHELGDLELSVFTPAEFENRPVAAAALLETPHVRRLRP